MPDDGAPDTQQELRQLQGRLRKFGERLQAPPTEAEDLLQLLNEVEECLGKVEQSWAESIANAIRPATEALVKKELMGHTDPNVRLAVASCISEITRITAPDAPYDDDAMRDVFSLIVGTFQHLDDIKSPSFGRRAWILDTVAKVRSCVVMLDLECDDLINDLFHHFLRTVSSGHPAAVISRMETIMRLIIEESEDVQPQIALCLLQNVRKEEKESSSPSFELAEKVIGSCREKLKPVFLQSLKGTSLSEYSPIVALVCEEGSVDKKDNNAGPIGKDTSTIKKRRTQVDGLRDPAPRLTKKHKSPKLGPSKENKHRGSSSKEIYPELLEKRLLRDSTIKKRETRVQGPPDPAARLTKKDKSPKLGPSKENKLHGSSSKEIYPELPEKRLLRDADTPRQDDQAQPAPQPKPAPAPAQRRKSFLKLSLPMIQITAAPDTILLSLTRESDAENNEAVHKTVSTPVPEAETCSKSPAESLPTPFDAIIKDLKDCREQWLHSATKAKEMEGHVAKLQADREADAQHLREVMDKQASLERKLELHGKEIEDLKKKLVDLDEQKSRIEAELPRGAVMAASHALGVLKNHLPDLDIGILSKGYACTPAEAQALADRARPIVEPFVGRLGLSVSSASEDESMTSYL